VGTVDALGLDAIDGNEYGDWEIDQSKEDGQLLAAGQAIAPRSTVTITFNPTKNCDCEEISYIQAIRFIKDDGTTMPVPGFHPDPETGYAIDRFPGRTSPYYGYDNEGNPLRYPIFDENGQFKEWTTQVSPGATSPEIKAAILRDRSQNTVGDFTHKFLSCIICKTGNDVDTVYGCLEWGFKAVNWKVQKLPRTHHDKPTAEFEAAATQWNSFDGNQGVPNYK